MKYKNSFFKIRIKEDGTYLDVFPPKEDGKRLDIREVVSFLEQKGFAGFSIDALRKTLDLLQEKPLQIKISDTCAKAFDESATIITGKDNMIAYIRFYPPSTGGKLMTGREIRAELEREKILYGILEPVMEKLKTTRTYCTNIPIAKGMAPMPAKDTVIEYFFNTKPLAKPKVLEDGSVDFHALNLFSAVNEGDKLAKLTPHDPGKPGMNIYGSHYLKTKLIGSSGGLRSDMVEALELIENKKMNPAIGITHIGGINAIVDTTLYLKKMPGSKKIIYPQIDLPLTAIEDFRKLGETDPVFAQLADACSNHGGLWNSEAESILLKHFEK